MATEESLIVGVVLVVLGVISAIYGTILCFTTKVLKTTNWISDFKFYRELELNP